jgi:hypothetical protein
MKSAKETKVFNGKLKEWHPKFYTDCIQSTETKCTQRMTGRSLWSISKKLSVSPYSKVILNTYSQERQISSAQNVSLLV